MIGGTYYYRGNDMLNIHYHYLDMAPKGRDEGDRGPFWVPAMIDTKLRLSDSLFTFYD
jgi:predicted dithiol-disulfide oxidoreductase (DUF899 family)